jgi:hypothetical protein
MSCEVVALDSDSVITLKTRESLLSDMQLAMCKRFFPLGFAIDIYTNRREVLKAAEESFGHRTACYTNKPLTIRIGVTKGHLDCPPPPIRRQYDHLYTMVADVQNHAVLDLRTGANFVWLTEGALSDIQYLRSNFLEKVTYLLLGSTFVTDIHAACVGRNGKGILLCGDSGAGKSTLAYGCARMGWTYTSDDTCYLINEAPAPRVIGHAHRVRFRPQASALFAELRSWPVVERMEGKPSMEVPISALPLRDAAPEADVCAIVYLRRNLSTKAQLVGLSRGSATERMSEDLYSAGEIRARHKEILQRMANIPTFELHYRGLDDAIEHLNRLIETL